MTLHLETVFVCAFDPSTSCSFTDSTVCTLATVGSCSAMSGFDAFGVSEAFVKVNKDSASSLRAPSLSTFTMQSRSNSRSRTMRQRPRIDFHTSAALAAMAGPPQLIQFPRTMDVLRFQAAAAVTASIDVTWGCLRNLYFTTITAATANTIFKAIRLKALRLWAPPSGANTGAGFAQPMTIRFREGNGMVGEDKIVSDVVTSSAGAHIHRKFSKATTDMGKWHLCSEITSSDIAFTIVNCPSGTVIDVHLGWAGWASGSDVQSLTCAALTTGRIYRNSLDNTTSAGAIGGSNFLPVGVVGSTGVAFG